MYAKKKRLESSRREAAAQILVETKESEMSESSQSVLQEEAVTRTKEVAVQTDSVSLTDSSTSISSSHYCCVKHSATMTDTSGRYIEALEEECLQATGKRLELKSNSFTVPWSESELKCDEHKVKFFTGLPSFSILMIVYNFVSSHITHGSKAHKLSKFEEFIATVMKLRLSLFDQDLTYRFGIHQTTISRNFRRWIDVMYFRLKPLIKWPRREELKKMMPLDFKTHFKKCVVIIDCFDIFCERPKPLKARAQTYSSYKHHNTVKYLIGIAP